MRVIAGSRGGIPLKSLPGQITRPTSDKVKESLFNMIGPYFDGGVVVELFGGSGSLSIEALSRGAATAHIFEKNRRACEVIQENIKKCRFTEQVTIHRRDARQAIDSLKSLNKQVDFLFLDPPYAQKSYYALVEKFIAEQLLTETAVIVCEHDKQIVLPEKYGAYQKVKQATYGNTALSIYKK